MGKEQNLYNRRFYRELESTRESAREILPTVVDLVKPASIVDIGCGQGHWLAEAVELGIVDVLGVDGAWALPAQLTIPRVKFLVHDLNTPVRLNRNFDLALSLEVAEHLVAWQARAFVQTLCQLADKVLFSAAIPGQGGRHHVNEQWPAYWAKFFAEFDFACFDVLRPKIWNNSRVLWYYAQNCLLYARRGTVDAVPVGEPLSLVHPQLWSAQVERLNSPGKLLERLPKAFLSLVRTKMDFRKKSLPPA
jgi:SAM-dependent methyltransferase